MPANKQGLLRDLSMHVDACLRCPYNGYRNNPVVGRGDPRAPILVVEDIARQSSDKSGEPFAGRAGAKLDKMLAKAELDPRAVYRTIAVRCYPGRENPYPELKAANRCRDFLKREIKILQPRVVILCGLKVLRWTLVRWSTESVDEFTLNKWMGPVIRFKQLWGELRFFVIQSPAQLAGCRNAQDEGDSVESLINAKKLIVAKQQGLSYVPDMIDLKRPKPKNKSQMSFDWGQSA